MHNLTRRVLRHIRDRQLLKAGDRLGIAVSGGPDSVGLLRLMIEMRDELGVVLSIVHFNHQIRGAEADADQQFVGELTLAHGLDLHIETAGTPSYSAEHRLSLEDAARRLRYAFFGALLLRGVVDKIATAHTRDDQAETVLMRIIRGTGTRGLAGILECIGIGGKAGRSGQILRPLLCFRRSEVREYLNEIGQEWREDSSNGDLQHTRNRVRELLMPMLETEFNPAASERLAELAEVARAEEEFWQKEMDALLQSAPAGSTNSLDVVFLKRQPLALQRRLVRAIVEHHGLQLEFQDVERILRLAECSGREEKQVVLSNDWTVVLREKKLRFEQRHPPEAATHYEYTLQVPGEIVVPEIGSCFRTSVKSARWAANQKIAGIGATSLVVRNWRAGDRYQPPHSKSAKKIKELLQEKHVPPTERQLWPVVLSGDRIVWVRGFAKFPSELDGVIIEEFPIQRGRRGRE